MTDQTKNSGFLGAAPFWMSLSFLPLVFLGATKGGWWLAVLPVYAIVITSILDAIIGSSTKTASTDDLFWFKLITWIWLPIQAGMIFACLAWAVHGEALSARESVFLMLGLGLVSGATGIVYAHELMHQTNRWERRLGELLMISVLYGHFVSEHLLVHHRHVGTPRDAVTARYNESFYRFVLRVLPGSFRSAWRAEQELLSRQGRPVWSRRNPFWRYLGGAFAVLLAAYLIGGWWGIMLYGVQAFMAIIALEQINYIEHYGIVRQKVEAGRYEPVRLHHSWNANHKVTNFLLINLQRHSDHHAAPQKRYPHLEASGPEAAPQLPFSYPAMAMLTYVPWAWRKTMNPRVKAWRKKFYPEVSDWSAVDRA